MSGPSLKKTKPSRPRVFQIELNIETDINAMLDQKKRGTIPDDTSVKFVFKSIFAPKLNETELFDIVMKAQQTVKAREKVMSMAKTFVENVEHYTKTDELDGRTHKISVSNRAVKLDKPDDKTDPDNETETEQHKQKAGSSSNRRHTRFQ